MAHENTKNNNRAAIIWLILVFPIGLLIMWLRTDWSKTVKWTITGVFALLTIVLIVTNASNPNNQQQQATTQSSDTSIPTDAPQLTEVPTVPQKPLTLTEKVKAALPDSMKDADIETDDAAEINNGTVTETLIPNKKAIILTEKLGNGFWDVNAAKEGVWRLNTDIIKKVFPADSSIYSITLIAQAPVTTAYGKNDYDTLEIVTFTRDTYNKIDFSGFDYKNIPTVADIYSENHTLK